MLCDAGQKQQNHTAFDIQGQHVLRHFCYPPGSANSNKVGQVLQT